MPVHKTHKTRAKGFVFACARRTMNDAADAPTKLSRLMRVRGGLAFSDADAMGAMMLVLRLLLLLVVAARDCVRVRCAGNLRQTK